MSGLQIKPSNKIIFDPLLTTIEASSIFKGSWDNNKNWLECLCLCVCERERERERERESECVCPMVCEKECVNFRANRDTVYLYQKMKFFVVTKQLISSIFSVNFF